MPRTLRQLWADEDDAHEQQLARKQRPTRVRAKQGGRLHSSAAARGKHRVR
jgi:hypothetical protein